MDYSSRSGNLSSRLAKREQKKAVRQTVMYLVTAAFLIVAFIFIIVPGFLRFVASLSGTTGGDPSDTFPPQVPVIAAPYEATSSATIEINGYGEADSQVVFVLNGNELEKKTIGSDGNFTASVPLTEGENQLAAYSIDANNNESGTGKTYTIVYDPQPPKLEISEPLPDQEYELRKNQTITIKGTTEANARVRVNGRLVFANSEGAFTTTYQLSEGDNKLTIEAEDKAGNKTQQELNVKFRL
jgi:uncharacterized protein YfaP (DUF2135 family)